MTMPGTFDPGTRVTEMYGRGERQGTVKQDNRQTGGTYVWVEWDDEAPVVTCADPSEFRAVNP